ncbi:hypothetical protein [Algoriphagus pacificus]|uniref:Uncharacterized protein n=1 Tax=Algoriphagus pacificus TaxID=2811234 RepID=A0ABS3CLS6_9BACT|nr:hypothetical protein [Algoriphagus pacificus]MBN7818044.1 hypothetical protein [Algoriphagus pacificus]
MNNFPKTPEEIGRFMRMMPYVLVAIPIVWLIFLYLYFATTYSEAVSPGFLAITPIVYVFLLKKHFEFKKLR